MTDPAPRHPDPLRTIIDAGLPGRAARQRVCVIGAGMAGLVAGWELKRAGHAVTILEAQTRVGGRILTFREPFSDGLYGEAGAMRIPTGHALTLAYCEQFALPLDRFITENPAAFVLVGDMTAPVRRSEFVVDASSGGLDPGNREPNPEQAWAAARAIALDQVAREGLDAVEARYANHSLRDFLEREAKWSERQIEIFGLLSHMESLMECSFIEILREEAGDWFQAVVTIRGGMDRLPKAFLAKVGDCLRFGHKVEAIRGEDGGEHSVRARVGDQVVEFGPFDRVIVTVPFSVLRNIDLPAYVSNEKHRAIRQLTYDASVKVFLQVRERFWETGDGIEGGASVTDRPIRACYYPLHGRDTGRGVLLASYTWGQDAIRWGAMTEHERIHGAIEDIREIHPAAPADAFEGGASKVWHTDPFAGGAFANFSPGQHARLDSIIARPEGRLHFAGEHASKAHAWIQGAIESGLRAASEVHRAAGGG